MSDRKPEWQTWPKEPWGVQCHIDSKPNYTITNNKGEIVGSWGDDGRVRRALACVNALASIPDPQAWRAAVERVVEAVAELHELAEPGWAHPSRWAIKEHRGKIIDAVYRTLHRYEDALAEPSPSPTSQRTKQRRSR